MATNNTCCGAFVQRKTKTVKMPLPANPKVQGGVAVIYLGAGDISLEGAETGAIYYASDHSRHFRVYKDDAPSILRRPYMIMKP